VALATPPLISPINCGEIAFRRDSRRGGPFSVIPAAAAVSNAASRLSGIDEPMCDVPPSASAERVQEFKCVPPLAPPPRPHDRDCRCEL
jgi:hypothetical protein